jgi:hypothetical protein
MMEPETHILYYSSQQSSSIRLRGKTDKAKKQFLKNRNSGESYLSLINTTDDVLTNTKVGTLDPGPVADGIQHNLRPLIRNKYMQQDTHLGHVEESLGSDWGTWGREGGGNIKHFKMIVQQRQEDTRSYHSLQYNTRY